MAFPQPNLINVPANKANYMVGRSGKAVKKITFHHVVGSAASAVSKFQSPVQVSSHFVVASDRIYCMVNTDDTAYTNGVWASNLESVTIEHEGTWLNGYRNEGVINQSAQLVAWLRSLYPNATPNRHRDIKATACPGQLPVEEIWDKATALLNPPKPVPTQPEWLKNRTPFAKTMFPQVGNVQLWKLDNLGTPADARTWAANSPIVIGSKTTVGGATYYITPYSTDKNIAAGFKGTDLAETPYTEPTKPPIPPPVVEPPVEPVPPPASLEDRVGVLEKIIQTIIGAIIDLASKLNPFKKG